MYGCSWYGSSFTKFVGAAIACGNGYGLCVTAATAAAAEDLIALLRSVACCCCSLPLSEITNGGCWLECTSVDGIIDLCICWCIWDPLIGSIVIGGRLGNEGLRWIPKLDWPVEP